VSPFCWDSQKTLIYSPTLWFFLFFLRKSFSIWFDGSWIWLNSIDLTFVISSAPLLPLIRAAAVYGQWFHAEWERERESSAQFLPTERLPSIKCDLWNPEIYFFGEELFSAAEFSFILLLPSPHFLNFFYFSYAFWIKRRPKKSLKVGWRDGYISFVHPLSAAFNHESTETSAAEINQAAAETTEPRRMGQFPLLTYRNAQQQ
jgi:hypothetical protein